MTRALGDGGGGGGPGDALEDRAGARARFVTMAVIGGVIAAGILLSFLSWRLVESQRALDLRDWQIRMSLVADSRVAAVRGRIEQEYQHLAGLAENLSVQIYADQIMRGGTLQDGQDALAAQAAYLRSLLTFVADRAGYVARPLGPEIDANVRRVGLAGIAIVDVSGRVIAATPGTPPIEGDLQAFVTAAESGTRSLLDFRLDPSGKPRLAFLVPLFRGEGTGRSSERIGSILGVKQVGDDFFALLRQPGSTLETAEAFLVRRADAAVEYLSPLRSGVGPLELRIAITTPELAAARAIEAPGGFALARNYAKAEVLTTGRRIPETPWFLVYNVDRDEALSGSDARLRRMLTGLLLAVLVALAAVLAIWRHGVSRRAAMLAVRYHALADRHEAQHRFLEIVTDALSERVLVVAPDGRVIYANRSAAQAIGMEAADVAGKSVRAVLGPDTAKWVAEMNERARATGAAVSATRRDEMAGEPVIIYGTHVPLGHTEGAADDVLVVEQDITEPIRERERRERTMRQLVEALAGIVDRRDPHAARHSDRVSRLARSIAVEMGLSRELVETAEVAGRLLNVGKIAVPEETLAQPRALTEEEADRVRGSILASAQLVAGIEFDGPVERTIRQSLEHYDGSGYPDGIAGDDILVTARIVSVANVFVAMISPRAHRASHPVDEAIELLLGDCGSKFDRKVVAALINYLENRSGRNDFDAVS
jgi:PAS domain S-box-containing protein